MSYYSAVPLHPIEPRRLRSLARFFALKHAREKGLPPRFLTRDAEDLIASHDWQDDFHGLSATIRRAVIMADGEAIDAGDIRLPAERRDQFDPSEWANVENACRVLMGQTLADVERELILLTLECSRGHREHAAEILGISVRTLRNKLHEYAQSGAPIPRPARSLKACSPVAERSQPQRAFSLS